MITPSSPVKSGSTFTVTVIYTGRPGVHHDGDGTTEGWFRAPRRRLRHHRAGRRPRTGCRSTTIPTAKPTYDFYDTINAGKTAVANGVLDWTRHNKPNAEFPGGSVT